MPTVAKPFKHLFPSRANISEQIGQNGRFKWRILNNLRPNLSSVSVGFARSAELAFKLFVLWPLKHWFTAVLHWVTVTPCQPLCLQKNFTNLLSHYSSRLNCTFLGERDQSLFAFMWVSSPTSWRTPADLNFGVSRSLKDHLKLHQLLRGWHLFRSL